MNPSRKKRLIFYLYLAICVLVPAYVWGPGSIQRRNMRQAQRELAPIKKHLEKDPRFSHVRIGVGTVSLGRVVVVLGNVPAEESLNRLKLWMGQSISDTFKVAYGVQIGDVPVLLGPNETNEPLKE